MEMQEARAVLLVDACAVVARHWAGAFTVPAGNDADTDRRLSPDVVDGTNANRLTVEVVESDLKASYSYPTLDLNHAASACRRC